MAARPLLLLLCLLLAAPPGMAASPEELRVASAARLREAENAVADAAQQVSALAQRRQEAEQAMRDRAAALVPLLPLAERLALFPAETLLAVPAPPEQAVQGLAVLRGLMRTVERQAAELRTQLDQVEAARRALEAALPGLRAAQAEQARQALQLDRELERRAHADDAAAEQARRAAVEATRAESVRGAIAAMDAARTRAQLQIRQDAERAERQRREAALALARRREEEVSAPAGPGVRAGGGAVLPVAGPVVRRWGERTDAGPANGISFRAPPLGRVVAPCAGRVAFAGPFRSYGTLVILDCGGGYHFVLAGLERLDTEAGAAVRAGEPLGVMPNWDPAAGGARPAFVCRAASRRVAGRSHPLPARAFLTISYAGLTGGRHVNHVTRAGGLG